MSARGDNVARAFGLVLGLALVGGAVAAWWIPASRTALNADARLSATPPGELTIEPRRLLAATGLEPGGKAGRGSVRVTSQVERPIAVAVRVRPEGPDLRRELWLELSTRDRVLARGPLGSLLRPSRKTFALAPGQSTLLKARAFLPDPASGYEGRLAEGTLHFDVRFTGGPR